MKVTRTIRSNVPDGITAICAAMGFVRADIWRRYGALRNVGKSAADIRREITEGGFYAGLMVDGTIRSETTKDVVNSILLYKAAAATKVRQAVAARTRNSDERKMLYSLLRKDEWLSDNFLHRQMRKHFKHGKSVCANQFIIRSDKHSSVVVDGKLTITIRIAKKYGDNITLVTTSSGKNVNLTGSNLRIVVKDGYADIHYATEKGDGREPGKGAIGIDKGYTEAFTDSEGVTHGEKFGSVLTEYSDKTAVTNNRRNKLHALEKNHRKAGNTTKAERIKKNNLGRKKIDARRNKTQKQLSTIAYQSAHTIVDKAAVVVSEDLTSPIAKK